MRDANVRNDLNLSQLSYQVIANATSDSISLPLYKLFS